MTVKRGEAAPGESGPSPDPYATDRFPNPTRRSPNLGTQLRRVLDALRRRWVCGTEFVSGEFDTTGRPVLRYSSRISELREAGWWIERRRCEHPWHNHDATMYQWRIHAEVPGDGQLFGEARW